MDLLKRSSLIIFPGLSGQGLVLVNGWLRRGGILCFKGKALAAKVPE